MKRFNVKTKEVNYLSTTVWADSLEEAEEKAESIPLEDYEQDDCTSEVMLVDEIEDE